MTWTAWRQQRSLVNVMAAVVTTIAILLILMGRHESEVWRNFLSNPCRGNQVSAAHQEFCQSRFQQVMNAGQFNTIAMIIGVSVGPFFGAMLGVNAVARELEVGTTRLAWTQSFSRSRWLLSKFIVNVAILTAVLGPLCLIYDWWNKATHYSARISPTGFPISGFMPFVYSVFAFSLVVLVGLYFRHTGWSLATGLLLTAVVVFFVETGIRPILVSPQFAVVSSSEISLGSSSGFYSSGGIPADSWGRGSGYAPRGTKSIPSAQLLDLSATKMLDCMNSPRGHARNGSEYCVTRLRLESVGLYVPESEFWRLQLSEYGIYLGFALCLAVIGDIRLRRMLA